MAICQLLNHIFNLSVQIKEERCIFPPEDISVFAKLIYIANNMILNSRTRKGREGRREKEET